MASRFLLSGSGCHAFGERAIQSRHRAARHVSGVALSRLPAPLAVEIPGPSVGRPRLDPDLRHLIRCMARENPTWGRRRIHAELALLGYHVAELTVAKYMRRRRELLHLNVTDLPTAAWTAQQLVEALPDDTAPKDLPRDRSGLLRQPVLVGRLSQRLGPLQDVSQKRTGRSSLGGQVQATRLVTDRRCDTPPRVRCLLPSQGRARLPRSPAFRGSRACRASRDARSAGHPRGAAQLLCR